MAVARKNKKVAMKKTRPKKRNKTKLFTSRRLTKLQIVMFVALFAVIGSITLLWSRAAINPPGTNRGAAYDKVGFYPGHVNDGGIETFQGPITNWLGRNQPIPFLLQFGARTSLAAFNNNNAGEFLPTKLGRYKKAGQSPPFKLVYSVPLGFGDRQEPQNYWIAEYDKIINNTGSYRADYLKLAQQMKDNGYGDAIIRLDWEFDLGREQNRRAAASPTKWIQAWKVVHGIFKSVSPDFKFDYNFISGAIDFPIVKDAYPGDAYVDIIGADFYDRGSAGDYCPDKRGWCDPDAAWASFETRLNKIKAFAVSKGKPISFPEWATEAVRTDGTASCGIEGCKLVGGDDPRYIRGMAEWMNALPKTGAGSLAYATWFWQGQSSKEGSHKLFESGVSDSLVPKARDEFKKWFGGSATGGSITDNAPTVSITSPAEGALVTGTVNIATTASDDKAVTKVTFEVDGATLSTDTTAPYNASWPTSGLSGLHSISATAHDAVGNTASDTRTVSLANSDGKPDLIVTDVNWEPAVPGNGQDVTFSATIQNIGTKATAPGVIIGVSFRVNDAVVSWSDTDSTSLAAGGSRTLIANEGPDGDMYWNKPATGNYNVHATVDGTGATTNRIDESSETNNAGLPEVLTVIDSSTGLPTPITNLKVSSIRRQNVGNVSWTASSHPSGIASYKLLLNGVHSKTATTTKTYLNALNGSTDYNLQVIAVANNGTQSTPATIKFRTARLCLIGGLCFGQKVY